MKILFFGTPDFAVPCLAALLDAGHEVVGAVSQPDKPQGRSMKLMPTPVKALAESRGVPVFQPDRLKEGQLRETLEQLQPDLCVVVAYGKILPDYILDFPKYGCINVHGSLLPRWRGAAPIQWAVLAGDKITGVTTMHMDRGLDTGDIIDMQTTEIGAHETAGELFDRLADMGARLLCDTVAKIAAGEATRTPQPAEGACYASMLSRDMAVIDWNRSADALDCFVRGMNPWPVAYTTLNGAPVKIFACEPVARDGKAELPGTVLSAGGDGIVVSCGHGALRITELQTQGGKRMPASVYCNGHKLPAGTRFGEWA